MKAHKVKEMTMPVASPIASEGGMVVRWQDLESVWHMLATPEKQSHIADTLTAVKLLSQEGPAKAVFTMVAATAWLTDAGGD